MGSETERTELGPVGRKAGRVALVHDFLLDLRGAERAFLELCDMWPEADIYTVVYDEDGTEGRFAGRNIHTSFLQRLHPSERTFRALLPLYPAAVESLALGECDLVLSSSSAWAHAVLCHERSTHVSYCYNPFRYAWSDRDRTLANRPDPLSRALLRGLFRRWRQWDWIAAQRVDHYIAISRTTQDRIAAYFGRDSVIVHPPVETSRFTPGPVGDHYVLVSELMRHKEIDIAVQAFNDLRLPLVVVGDGPDWRRLRRMAGPTIRFAGRLPDREVAEVVSTARALIVTAVEEFGIVAVEAQAAGRPVIARRGGGALETVIPDKTGCFWSGGPRTLARTVLDFDEDGIDPEACRANAARFDSSIFRRRMLAQVEEATRQVAESATRPPRPVRTSGRRVRRSAGPRR